MSDQVKIILDLSPEVQKLLEQQDTDIYQELRNNIPSIRITKEPDPQPLVGAKGGLVTVLWLSINAAIVVRPVILRILNLITPPNRTESWQIEETETRSPDGTTTIQRKRVFSSKEERIFDKLEDQTKLLEQPSAEKTNEMN